MRPKSLLLLALALGCGLVASIGISQVMDRNNNSHGKMETVPIYVALHNINLGDPIDAKMLSLQEWPKDRVPRGAISTLEELQGRRPRTTIIEGEPILDGKLLNKGEMSDPIRGIAKGMRLFTIKVDAEKSAAGLLGPGDRVDVQLFVRKDQRTGVETAKSKIILQNVRVYAVDQSVQRSADGGEERSVAKTISLLLKPEQASKLSLATQVGEISLIPRNPDDEDQANVAETTVDELLRDGEMNSRAKEQGAHAKEKEQVADKSDNNNNNGGGLLNAIKAAVIPKAPYRMEIVEAQTVREVLFDGDTGRPIRQGAEPAAPAGPTVHPTTGPSTGGPSPTTSLPSGPAPTAGDKSDEAKTGDKAGDKSMDKLLEEFPIDFNQPK